MDENEKKRQLAELLLESITETQDRPSFDVIDEVDNVPPYPRDQIRKDVIRDSQEGLRKRALDTTDTIFDKVRDESDKFNRMSSFNEMSKPIEEFGSDGLTRTSENKLIQKGLIDKFRGEASETALQKLKKAFGGISGKQIATRGAGAALGLGIPAVAEGFDAEPLGPQRGDEGYDIENPSFKSGEYASQEEKEISDEELRMLVGALSKMKGEQSEYEGTLVDPAVRGNVDEDFIRESIMRNIENLGQ